MFRFRFLNAWLRIAITSVLALGSLPVAAQTVDLLYRGNAKLRRMGFDPRPVGASALADRSKAALLGAYTGINAGIKRALGRGVRDNSVAYAPA